MGHSKGGLVAGITAAENNAVDKLILMSSPAIPLSNILIYQFSRKIKNMPFTKEQKLHQIDALKNLIRTVANDGNIDKAKKTYHEQLLNYLQILPDSVQTSIQTETSSSDLKMAADKITNVRLRLVTVTKRIKMLSYNPATDLKTLEIPVFVLLGGKDIQVTVEMNKKPIKQALEKNSAPYKIKVFPNANHLFQKTKSAETPYRALKDKFVDGLLKTITRWIKE